MNRSQIFINGRFLTQQISGVQRYAMEIVKAMDTILNARIVDNADRFILLSPKKTIHNLQLHTIEQQKMGSLSGHFWEQIELPFYAGKNPILNFYTTPIFKRNQIATIHDASVFEAAAAYSRPFAMFYRSAFRAVSRRARKLITVSEFSKNRLAHYCDISPNSFLVVQGGHEHISHIQPDDMVFERFGINRKKPFILTVSSINPNKNLQGIIKALGYLTGTGLTLVIAGGINRNVFNTKDISFPSDAKYIGYVNDRELGALYKNAICLAHPSFYEGFGLPPLEAMACGCPVIASHVASLPEICGNAVAYCDPNSPEDIALKIRRLSDSPELRKELVEKGIERARSFTWRKSAQQLLATLISEFNL
jgi:glycosyltransferase involved in cell wall biosynthesis